MFRIRRLLPLALIPALALVATACGDTATAPAAAHVLGTDVTDAQLASTAGVFKALFGLQHAACGELSGAGDTEAAACNRYSLGALIQFRLAETYANGNGVAVTDADLASAIDGFESQVGKDTLATQLQANGVSHDDFAQLVRQSLLENEVSRQLAVQHADDAKLRTAYERNLAPFTTLTVDHILVKTKAEAEQAYREVTAPGATRDDFLALAKRISIDPSAKQNSGALPATPASQLDEGFARAAIALAPGEISHPVHTQYGWHVIHLVDKKVTPFEQVRDQLVSQQEQVDAFTAWVHEQLATGQVDVNPSFGRFDPDSLQVVRITSTDPSASPSSTPSGVPSGIPSASP
jgi:parvulin-like peptidyl-prolyl isomerase